MESNLQERRQDIEILRVFSVFGIVWYHSNVVGGDYAYSGLIFFVILSAYLSGPAKLDFRLDFLMRAQRLLVPWLIWYFVYGLVNVIRGRPLVDTSNGLIAGILQGPSIHLSH